VTVADARFAKPIDAGLAAQLAAEHELLVTVEEGVLAGGFGSAVWETLSDAGVAPGGSSASGCPTATSPTARRRCCTTRSGSPASGSPSGSPRALRKCGIATLRR
jgi:deoxyxylulose-5-phosphate synthase